MTLEQEFAAVLNRHGAESQSGTPDFILAQYLMICLAAWNVSTQRRDLYYLDDEKSH